MKKTVLLLLLFPVFSSFAQEDTLRTTKNYSFVIQCKTCLQLVTLGQPLFAKPWQVQIQVNVLKKASDLNIHQVKLWNSEQ